MILRFRFPLNEDIGKVRAWKKHDLVNASDADIFHVWGGSFI